MSKPVLELQKLASNENVTILDLLRKAFIVAKKLKIEEFIQWTEKELNGYDGKDELPSYRKIRGETKVFNPATRTLENPIFQDPSIQDLVSIKPMTESIIEIQEFINHNKEEGVVTYKYPPKTSQTLRTAHSHGFEPYLNIQIEKMVVIIERGRQIILEWSLDLESSGIIGNDEVNFDQNEVEKASKIEYHIRSFTGVIGNVSGSNLQFGDYSEIHNLLKEKGISQRERNEFENIVDDLKEVQGEEKKTVLQKAKAWISKNAKKLGAASEIIRNWVETISGL